MDRLERALLLVDAFRLQGELRTSDVMRILEVDRPSAMRLLQSVKAAGAPIEHVGAGIHRRWVVTDPTWRRLGLAVSPGDAFALHFGRQLLGFADGTALTEWHDDLRNKLKIGTSGKTADLEQKLARRFVFLSEPFRRYEAVDEALDEVISALLLGVELEMDYDARGTERRWARVKPLALVVYRRALYLLVRLDDHRNVLRLAVERIRSARRTKREFAYPRDFDVHKELRRTFGIFDDQREPETVRMRFSAQVADLVVQRTWHPTGSVELRDDGTAVLTMFASGIELARLALEFGSMVEVLEPPWLREEVQRELRSALALYQA